MFGFKRKKEPEKLYIPFDDIEDFLELYDTWQVNRSNLARYKFWNFVAAIFPETEDANYVPILKDVLHPYIQKK